MVILICGKDISSGEKKIRKIAKIKLEKLEIRNLIGDMSDTLLGQVS